MPFESASAAIANIIGTTQYVTFWTPFDRVENGIRHTHTHTKGARVPHNDNILHVSCNTTSEVARRIIPKKAEYIPPELQ